MKSLFKWARVIICLRNLNIKNVRDQFPGEMYCIIALIASCAYVAVFPKFDLKTVFLIELGWPRQLAMAVLYRFHCWLWSLVSSISSKLRIRFICESRRAHRARIVSIWKRQIRSTWALSFIQMIFSSWVQLLKRVSNTEGTSRLFAFLYFQGFLTPAPRPWGK